MPEFQIYTDETLPDGYAYQRMAFIRIHWDDSYVNNPDMPLKPVIEPETRHYLYVAGEALVSAASVVRREITCDGVPYVCYGMSAVMTFPFFRKNGYGSQVVKAATDHMQAQPDADVALLWTSPDRGPWYSKFGWEAMPGLTIWVGDPQSPHHDDDSFLMMMFISDRAKQNRETIVNSRIYVGEWSW